jgi:hypothetical protein
MLLIERVKGGQELHRCARHLKIGLIFFLFERRGWRGQHTWHGVGVCGRLGPRTLDVADRLCPQIRREERVPLVTYHTPHTRKVQEYGQNKEHQAPVGHRTPTRIAKADGERHLLLAMKKVQAAHPQ